MALKPTIYKLKIALSNLDCNYYDSFSLTVARHPSETLERMVARMLAFCTNAHKNPSFTKGLSSADEPALWVYTLDNQISLWVDVGEPTFDRIKKAKSLAETVKIYSFNTKSDVWWNQENSKFSTLNIQAFQFPWLEIQAFANMVERTMDFSITIVDHSIYIATQSGEFEVTLKPLQFNSDKI